MNIIFNSTSVQSSVLRAILAIALGVVMFIWPQKMLDFIFIGIGIVFLTIGIVSLVLSYERKKRDPQGTISYSSIGSIILGILLICVPGTFQNFVMYLLGFVLIFAGVGQLLAVAAARQFGYVAPVRYLMPVLILMAGVFILFRPKEMAENIFRVVIIFYGLTSLFNQYLIYKMRKTAANASSSTSLENHDDIQDVDYEEVDDAAQH